MRYLALLRPKRYTEPQQKYILFSALGAITHENTLFIPFFDSSTRLRAVPGGLVIEQGWGTEALLDGMERKPEGKRVARALDAQKVESVLRKIEDPRDRALFWLIYDGGLRSQEALSIDIEDISWPDRSIRLHGKGDRPREMFFSRAVGTLLDKYLATRGNPTSGPLFVTHRKARLPRRADLDADGYARLSYRQADTLWKRYTPDWDLHQLRHTAISLRAAHDYTEVDLKRFSGHSSLRSLERYIADNREAAKRKARE